MGQTTGDNLRYPELADPANVPQDMLELATDVQAALDTKPDLAYTQVNISRATGWTGGQPTAQRFGKQVILSSNFTRNGSMANVEANTAYTLGTLPSGYRPKAIERYVAAWYDGTRRFGQVFIATDGEITWYPTANTDLEVGDYVSVSGLVFMTP